MEGEGYFYFCWVKDKYLVCIDYVMYYSDKFVVDNLCYVFSYLVKQDQKEYGIILGCSRFFEKSNWG